MVRLRLMRHRELSKVPAPDLSPSGEGAEETGSEEGVQLAEARKAAIGFLAYREYALAELADRLESRGFARHICRRVTQQLAEDGLQSDQRFAEVFSRSRLERGCGPMLLRAELRARGLDDELIDDQVDRGDEFWVARASAAVQKHFKEAPGTRESWGVQARYLGRKGFSSHQIYAALGHSPD